MEQLFIDVAKQMPFVALLGYLLWTERKKSDKQGDEHREERSTWRKEIKETQDKFNEALLRGITAIEVMKERMHK